MFLKNVKLLRSQSLSLVTKLMVFYSVSTIGLLGSICLFLYPTFTKLIAQINGTPATNLTVECFERIIIILLICSLFAIGFGYVIAKKGLHRLRDFEQAMTKMTADSLDHRISLEDWPKELQSLAQTFNQMLERLQTSFTQLSRFSSDIAHELRTPIHNLKGMIELALLKDSPSNDYKHTLESCILEYEHLSKLIENLLFIARSDHGQIMLQKEPIAIQKEIMRICEYYQAMADDNQITVTYQGDAYINVDPTLFKRVISNVLSNALRYATPQGSIRIDITPLPTFIQIAIHDTGIGIASEHLPHLGNRFYRIDPSRSAQLGGLGLGLAIVKSIMQLHHGHLIIESQVTAGTSVYLQFPSA